MVDIQAKLKEIGPFVEGPDDNLLVCRCEEVTKGQIRKAVRIVKIEVITGMSKLTDLIQNLSKVGVRGATVMQVLGCGIEMGTPEYEVERNEVMELLPKQQINIVVEAEKVDKIVDIIKKELYTGHIGDGKIFIYDIDNVIRVRTGDEGVKAL